jgi:hypothetical protein
MRSLESIPRHNNHTGFPGAICIHDTDWGFAENYLFRRSARTEATLKRFKSMCKDIAHRDGGWGWCKTAVVLDCESQSGKFGG